MEVLINEEHPLIRSSCLDLPACAPRFVAMEVKTFQGLVVASLYKYPRFTSSIITLTLDVGCCSVLRDWVFELDISAQI
jgi:hypothetical protein